MNAIANMRIVDASIMPKIITGNLNAPVMMMAEKIADRIRGKAALAPSTASYFTSKETQAHTGPTSRRPEERVTGPVPAPALIWWRGTNLVS